MNKKEIIELIQRRLDLNNELRSDKWLDKAVARNLITKQEKLEQKVAYSFIICELQTILKLIDEDDKGHTPKA